jgi:hypothetical protein
MVKPNTFAYLGFFYYEGFRVGAANREATC